VGIKNAVNAGVARDSSSTQKCGDRVTALSSEEEVVNPGACQGAAQVVRSGSRIRPGAAWAGFFFTDAPCSQFVFAANADCAGSNSASIACITWKMRRYCDKHRFAHSRSHGCPHQCPNQHSHRCPHGYSNQHPHRCPHVGTDIQLPCGSVPL
jgi:hypothetical protein